MAQRMDSLASTPTEGPACKQRRWSVVADGKAIGIDVGLPVGGCLQGEKLGVGALGREQLLVRP
jgi:hypothetical protein